MDIKNRLTRLTKLDKKNQLSGKSAIDFHKLASELGGCLVSRASHHFIKIKHFHQIKNLYGTVSLNQTLDIPGHAIATLSKNKVTQHFNIKKALFVDTETTGLSGGTGTYAFLIGVGYFDDEQFICEQYFLPSPAYEALMLDHLKECATSFDGIVSFNGKSFDIPIINSRCIQNRIAPFLDVFPNLDLLHAARRIWRDDFGRCTLQTLEQALLGLTRVGDIPGSEIPGIYMDFVASGHTEKLHPILEHNRLDIVSMAALLVCLNQVLSTSTQNPQSPDKIKLQERIARLFAQTDQTELAIARYQSILQLAEKDNADIAFNLAALYKKNNDLNQAIPLWERILQNSRFHFQSAIELAKYVEHKERNPQKALLLVEKALEVIAVREKLTGLQQGKIKEDLFKRQHRLQEKINRDAA